MEDPVIMSDAVLWLTQQPLDYSGNCRADMDDLITRSRATADRA